MRPSQDPAPYPRQSVDTSLLPGATRKCGPRTSSPAWELWATPWKGTLRLGSRLPLPLTHSKLKTALLSHPLPHRPPHLQGRRPTCLPLSHCVTLAVPAHGVPVAWLLAKPAGAQSEGLNLESPALTGQAVFSRRGLFFMPRAQKDQDLKPAFPHPQACASMAIASCQPRDRSQGS